MSQYEEVDDGLELSLRTKERIAIDYYQQWAKDCAESDLSYGEILSLMQHQGVPTRLVDFTEIPLVALYFALEDKTETGSFAVWASVADTDQNSHVAKLRASLQGENLVQVKGFCAYKRPRIRLDYDIVSLFQWDESDRSLLEAMLQDQKVTTDVPILKYMPRILNNRQRAQRGLFLACTKLSSTFMSSFLKWVNAEQCELKSKERITLDELLQNNGRFRSNFSNPRLLKFVFPVSMRRTAREFLEICNLNKQSLFDDMEGTTEYVSSILESKARKLKKGC